NEAVDAQTQDAGSSIGKRSPDYKGRHGLVNEFFVGRAFSLWNLVFYLGNDVGDRHRSANEPVVQVPQQAILAGGIGKYRSLGKTGQRTKRLPDRVAVGNVEVRIGARAGMGRVA